MTFLTALAIGVTIGVLIEFVLYPILDAVLPIESSSGVPTSTFAQGVLTAVLVFGVFFDPFLAGSGGYLLTRSRMARNAEREAEKQNVASERKSNIDI